MERGAIAVALLAAALGRPALGHADEQAADDAPDRAGDAPDDQGRWTLFPVISSSPETSLMLGGLTMFHFRVGGPAQKLENGATPRRSSLGLIAAYTFKNQFLFSFWPSVYVQGETWHISGSLDAQWFPDTFYEVGRDSAEDSAEDFTQRSFGGAVAVTRKLVSSIRAGVHASAVHATLTEVESGGSLDTNQVLGSDGGLVIGFGPTLSWDDRDRDMASRTGALCELSATFYPSAIGSDFSYATASLDARRYVLVTSEHVLAVQGYARFSWGDVPFQGMARLGGSNALRGYFAGRHIDVHMVAAQAEYRLPLYWKIGATLFAGVGDVAGDLGELDPLALKYAGGVGLRYALNKKDGVNLRVDFALTGDRDFGFYISLGEAF